MFVGSYTERVVLRAYKFRTYPTAEQELTLRRTFGCVRWVWNALLAEQRDRTARGEPRLSYQQTSARLTAWKRQPEYGWLNEVSSVPLQQVLRHLDQAHAAWRLGRARAPVFRRKHDRREAAEFTRSAFTWDEARFRLKLGKVPGSLRIRWSRRLPRGCFPSTVTVTRDSAGRTFVSLLVDEPIDHLPVTDGVTALDCGLSAWVTSAQGERIANPRCYAVQERQLARAQRSLARKQKGSRNQIKARLRLARMHAHIKDARWDALHKLTTRIVTENQTIVLESLNVRGMLRNHHLAKAVSDASWGEMVRQIRYKAAWYGRTVVQASQWFPSTCRCSACGAVSTRLPLNVRVWTCGACGVRHDRDVNAAKNLLLLVAEERRRVGDEGARYFGLAVGHTVAACGGAVSPAGIEVPDGAARRSRKTRERSPSGIHRA